VLDALGDPTRRRILELVRDGARPVGEIAREVPVSRPAVSQHLRVLKEAGLVHDRQEGTRRLYAVDPSGLSALRAYLDRGRPQIVVGRREECAQGADDAEIRGGARAAAGFH